MSSPSFQSDFVELIVREVIKRLLEQGVSVASETAIPQGTVKAQPETPELLLTEKLVTLETLRNRLANVRRVRVGCRAIVTPAVKDELKKLRIELIRN